MPMDHTLAVLPWRAMVTYRRPQADTRLLVGAQGRKVLMRGMCEFKFGLPDSLLNVDLYLWADNGIIGSDPYMAVC